MTVSVFVSAYQRESSRALCHQTPTRHRRRCCGTRRAELPWRCPAGGGLSGTATPAVVKHYSIHNRYTDETRGKTLKHSCVSRHRFRVIDPLRKPETQQNTSKAHQHTIQTQQYTTKTQRNPNRPQPSISRRRRSETQPKLNQHTVKHKIQNTLIHTNTVFRATKARTSRVRSCTTLSESV